MTSQDPHGVQINRVHSGAICTEIGERLRTSLAGKPTRLPPDLLALTALLDSAERGDVAIEIDVR